MTRRPSLTLLLTALLLALTANSPAQAAGYRYWSFWDRTGTHWTYATQGPSTTRPTDGTVQGFRFAVSEDSADAKQPRAPAPDFTTICANSPAVKGKKRVALVIDFGTRSDAPSDETPPTGRTACATVPPDATTAEALATVAKPLRYDTNALLCAINGYPEQGCGEQLAKKTTPHEGPSVGLLAGTTAIALLAAAALWQTRRRRHG
ncbi:SCO2322 family protein [Streptomyces sp. W16]|uniref:SCO2322 family protein n=1 Tax=Streptomyces sp. W16 TaxID=3076631 RepID=UPI00295BA099|nr:SCO2322 family protein [Streptomyces sp. W16]MDV9176431.1 SCO2322 family protein [Streptomyces sp. W16]